MKKVWILALSLLMVLTLLVACKETKDPVDTSGETATGAAAVTEPETEPKTDPETEMETEPQTEWMIFWMISAPPTEKHP